MTAAPASAHPPAPVPPGQWEDLDDFIAATEDQRWKYAGTKERHIARWVRANTPDIVAGAPHAAVTRYYMRLNVLIDTPTWAADHPALAARLRAHREGA